MQGSEISESPGKQRGLLNVEDLHENSNIFFWGEGGFEVVKSEVHEKVQFLRKLWFKARLVTMLRGVNWCYLTISLSKQPVLSLTIISFVETKSIWLTANPDHPTRSTQSLYSYLYGLNGDILILRTEHMLSPQKSTAINILNIRV